MHPRRLLLVALTSSMTSPAMGHGGPTPRPIAVLVEIRRDSGAIAYSSGPLSLSAGFDSDIEAITKLDYVMAVVAWKDENGNETVSGVPTVLEHGVRGSVSLVCVQGNRLIVDARITWTDLLEVDSFQGPGGITIHHPDIDIAEMVRTLSVAPGAPASERLGSAATLSITLVDG